MLAGGTGIWLLLALGVWLFVKYRRDFPTVRYTDLVWPGRWPQYRASQGDHYIAQAGALISQGDHLQALHKLRVGVLKAPANTQGRLLLTRLYLAYRRPDLAKQTLLNGLPHLGSNPEYLRSVLSFLIDQQEDIILLGIAGDLLSAPEQPAGTRPLLAAFAATAAYYRGNYDQAENFISRYGLRDSPDGAMLQARIAWTRGFPELALLRLKEQLALHPGHDATRALLADYCLQLGRTNEWEATLVERVTSDPLASAPRIAYFQLHHRRGDSARLEQEATTFLHQFSQDPAALLLLADFAASTGRPALAALAQQALAAHPESAGAAALMLAEAHIVAGEYQPALSLIARHTQQYPEWAAQFSPVLTGLQTVALAGLGRNDEARLQLDHLLARKNLRAENLVAVATRLSALGARDLAHAALTRAITTDPLNQAALASLIRLELETGAVAALPDHLRRFLQNRQPSRALLAQAHTTLGSDRYLMLPEQKALLASLQTALATPRP